MLPRFSAPLTVVHNIIVVVVVILAMVATNPGSGALAQSCCRAVPWQPNCGLLSSATTMVASAPITPSSWPQDRWYVSVQELRVTDGQPYDVALVRLNASTTAITGQSTLVAADIDEAGLAVFQSFASALRAGTTNIQFHFENSTAPVWVDTVHLHRSISTDQKVSARLELYSASDDALLYQRTWLWDTTLVSNVIVHSIPVDTVHGPVSRMRLSFWGSGYAAVGLVRVCQQCVSATPTPSQSPSVSALPTPSPSAPPSVGHACQTGAKGVCASGTWHRNDAGSLVCVMSTLPSREICDGLDNDCDGLVDEDFAGLVVECGTGICYRVMPMCSTDGILAQCMPGVAEPQEVCDGLDNDCNGLIDDGLPVLSCGIGACYRQVASCVNGTSVQCVPGSPQPEQCDGVDNDCDGVVDENNVCGHPSYVVAQPLTLPIVRCVETSSIDGGSSCRAHWDLIVTTDEEAVGDVAFESLMFFDQHEDGDADAELNAPVHPFTNASVLVTPLSNGQHEHYYSLDMQTTFACARSQSWRTSDFAHERPSQYATADRYTPECSVTSAQYVPLDVHVWSADNDGSASLMPLLDGCVQRLDGYCTATFGYYMTAALARLDVPVNAASNYVSASSTAMALVQAQPVRFYPTRVYGALLVRAECATATLDQWWLQWHLGNAVARASARDICTTATTTTTTTTTADSAGS